MLSALDICIGEIVQADELWNMPDVDRDCYVCRECGVKVVPAAILPKNRVRPYFTTSQFGDHEDGCTMEDSRERALLDRAHRGRLTNAAGDFPGTCPNSLDLCGNKSGSTAAGRLGAVVRGPLSIRGEPFRPAPRRWAAKTLRPIAQSFINFPYDREYLDLHIPGIEAAVYKYAFKRLEWGVIKAYPLARVFYAAARWGQPAVTADHMDIALDAGVRNGNTLENGHYLRVNWAQWTARQKESLEADVNTAWSEHIKAKEQDSGTRVKGYVFFIAQQNPKDIREFNLWDHRLVCCIVDAIDYP
jgi:hypothetical protein